MQEALDNFIKKYIRQTNDGHSSMRGLKREVPSRSPAIECPVGAGFSQHADLHFMTTPPNVYLRLPASFCGRPGKNWYRISKSIHRGAPPRGRGRTPMDQTFQFKLNGRTVSVTADGDRMLLWVLRADLGLTGTKYGCGESRCGACTVIVNKEAVRSCQMQLKDVAGKEVISIEGLAANGNLHPLQKAFVQHGAFQCGFCTSGMILNANSLLLKNARPTRAQIMEDMSGNLCRCGTHSRILDAIQAAAKEMNGGKGQ
jgi:aerobic-type carbon monoxide dehydrogenase small subunit (CoxS/CutS family)